ncbi:MAG: hypothetical protein HKN74_11870 [Acidimicrobiia bacterium]|nr:hypothetical protein [Acidimicrobiia bacterium]
MSDRCPICAGALSADSSSCPSCGHELSERAPTGAFVSRYEEAELTTDSLLSAPAVYRKLLEREEANPLWYESGSDDPLAVPLPLRERPREWWPAVIVAAIVAVIAVFGVTQLFGSSNDPEVEVLGVEAETTTPSSTPTTAAASSTTAAPTTTTVPATTTTITTLPPLTIIPSGEPIALSNMRLGAYALEPFQFGENFNTVLSRLGASLDEASEIGRPGVSGGEFGTCAGDVIQTVRWGRLLVIGVEDTEGVMRFAGYRLDSTYDTFRFPVLRTISRVGVGDRISDLEAAYSRVSYLNDESHGLVFQVKAGDGSLLLWGPVTSNEATGEILGIYSPNSCSS